LGTLPGYAFGFPLLHRMLCYLTTLFEELHKITMHTKKSFPDNVKKWLQLFPHPLNPAASETTSPELMRIATALERIATALEELTAANADISAISPKAEIDWITLPDAEQPSALQVSEKTPPAIAVPKPPLVNPALNDSTAGKAITPAEVQAPTLPIVAPENSVLRTYLNKRGITIQEQKENPTPQKQAYQAKLDQLAFYLGQNFTDCQALYKAVKSNMLAPRQSFDYSLKGATADQNKLIREFCRLLKEAELLEEYAYQGKPEFTIQLKATGKEQKYLSGAWLENYVRQEVARIAQAYLQPDRRYEALSNPRIIFKDGSKGELDLFFALGQQIFCIETKMRPGQSDLTAYLERIKPLTLARKAILIVVVDKSQEECQKLSQALGKVQVIQLASLEPTLHFLLKAAS
jgi:hypothetical protein